MRLFSLGLLTALCVPFAALAQPVKQVEVTNLPAVQEVAGGVEVVNLPEVQEVTGTVEVTGHISQKRTNGLFGPLGLRLYCVADNIPPGGQQV